MNVTVSDNYWDQSTTKMFLRKGGTVPLWVGSGGMHHDIK